MHDIVDGINPSEFGGMTRMRQNHRMIAAAIALIVGGCNAKVDEFASAKSAVARKLKDPDSAKFGQFERCRKNQKLVTVTVNAKNAFGAYAGDSVAYVYNGSAWLPDEDWPLEQTDGRYSLMSNFQRACYLGGDPDPIAFMEAVVSGKAKTVAEINAEFDQALAASTQKK